MRTDLTQERLKELLHYDPETGVFTWIEGRFDSKGRRITRYAGKTAGTPIVGGYVSIVLQHPRRAFLGHRLAWLYHYGVFPPHLVDHINRNRGDNRIINLRLATRSENCMNAGMWSSNTSGYKGVCFNKKRGLWMAHVKKNQKNVFQEHFESKKDAVAAVKAARIRHHGEFANHGSKVSIS